MNQLFFALNNMSRIFSDKSKSLWYDERLQTFIDKASDEIQKKWVELNAKTNAKASLSQPKKSETETKTIKHQQDQFEKSLPKELKIEELMDENVINYPHIKNKMNNSENLLSEPEISNVVEIAKIPEIPEIAKIAEIAEIPEIQENAEIAEITEIQEIAEISDATPADEVVNQICVSVIGSRTSATKLMISLIAEINQKLLQSGQTDLQNVYYYSDKPNNSLNVMCTNCTPYSDKQSNPSDILIDNFGKSSVHIVDCASSKNKDLQMVWKNAFGAYSKVHPELKQLIFFIEHTAVSPLADIAVVDVQSSNSKIDKLYNQSFSIPSSKDTPESDFYILHKESSAIWTLDQLLQLIQGVSI